MVIGITSHLKLVIGINAFRYGYRIVCKTPFGHHQVQQPSDSDCILSSPALCKKFFDYFSITRPVNLISEAFRNTTEVLKMTI